MDNFILEGEQRIPVYAEADVLVVGGGPAGYCAAVSAARTGASVALMERYGYLGGMGTGGYVLLIDCLCNGKGDVVIKGLVEETIERLRGLNGIIEPPSDVWGSEKPEDILRWRRWGSTGGEDKIVRYSPVADPEMWKCVANDMIMEAGVKPIFHAWFSRAYVENETIKGAIFESKSGRMAVLAKAVIDCTGDGDVFVSCGEEYSTGNLPLGLVFRMGNVDTERAEEYLCGEGVAERVSKDLRQIGGVSGGYSFGILPQGFYMRSSIPNVVWFNTTMSGDGVNIDDLARVEIETRSKMLVTVDYFKKNVSGFEEAVVMDTAPQAGVRSTRMLKGEYVITRKELIGGAVYDDAVVMAQPPYKKFSPSDRFKEIPYRCFLPTRTDGLLVAGRCLSGDFGAIEMLRVIPTAMLMGQACGTAAALAVRQGKRVRDVDAAQIRRELRAQNVLMPERFHDE
ncbi:MAG: FAD-dependent oxidoreductase [Candidatus Pelethousia sp.]|nr:FAD-dependent oxidoreductase [Candidatus Pelethousia sp.]